MCKKIQALSFVSFIAMGLSSGTARASDLDQNTQTALAETKAMLADPQARAMAIQADPNAVRADQNLKKLGFQKASEEKAYQISSKIMEKMVKETGGDPVALQKRLAELLRNPASLEKDLDPESLAAIQKMAQEIQPAASKQP